MGIEIERKFRVQGDDWRLGATRVRIAQGYLNNVPARTVRVRIMGNQGFLTVKGVTTGVSRVEFEYEVSLEEAQAMLALCDGPVLDKIRHLSVHGDFTWEVDEFLGANTGLVVAEIELVSEAQEFPRPHWLGQEVTDDPRYYNSRLTSQPYSTWGEVPPAGDPASRLERCQP